MVGLGTCSKGDPSRRGGPLERRGLEKVTFCAAWMSSRLTLYVRDSPCCLGGCSIAAAAANDLATPTSCKLHRPRLGRRRAATLQLGLASNRAGIIDRQ